MLVNFRGLLLDLLGRLMKSQALDSLNLTMDNYFTSNHSFVKILKMSN